MANPKPGIKFVPKAAAKMQAKPYKAKTPAGKDLKKVDDFLESSYPGMTSSSTYKKLKSGVKDLATAMGFKKGGAVKAKKKKK